MLVIQSSFKTDLETNRSIFIIYVSNGSQTFNCAIDYDLIKNSINGEQLYNNISPGLLNLLKAAYPEKSNYISDEEEQKISGYIKKSAEEDLSQEEKDDLCFLISKKSGFKKPEEVKLPE